MTKNRLLCARLSRRSLQTRPRGDVVRVLAVEVTQIAVRLPALKTSGIPDMPTLTVNVLQGTTAAPTTADAGEVMRWSKTRPVECSRCIGPIVTHPTPRNFLFAGRSSAAYSCSNPRDTMETNKVWFITGAGRGLGADIAKAALAAGDSVVATGRDLTNLAKALGPSNSLLAVKLDVTKPAEAEAATRAAMDRFGRIDVLVNNAANFYAGYFEELTVEQIEQQLAASLIGPMHVTRAILPAMRKRRSGHIMAISSSAGLAGGEFCSAYCAAKFGLEGWMESLQAEVAPLGIATTIVNPGFFRTELLTEQSTKYAGGSIAEYADRRRNLMGFFQSKNGTQAGDPAKLARALVVISRTNPPPRRFIAGQDAIDAAQQKITDLKAQIDYDRKLSTSLDFT